MMAGVWKELNSNNSQTSYDILLLAEPQDGEPGNPGQKSFPASVNVVAFLILWCAALRVRLVLDYLKRDAEHLDNFPGELATPVNKDRYFYSSFFTLSIRIFSSKFLIAPSLE